tara:strand:+ start:184 stop:447 length:264 start_codon:yes stop_codon:yes gene_type:complete
MTIKRVRTILLVITGLGAILLAFVPYVELPARVEDNADSIRAFSREIKEIRIKDVEHEKFAVESLCLMRLTFQQDGATISDALACGS